MKILCVQTGFLGDVILSTPVFSNLKTLYPASDITALVQPHSAALLEAHPALDQVLSFDKRGRASGLLGLFSTAANLAARRFDVVFSLHKSYRTAALLRMSRIPERYGFTESSAAFCYSRTASRSGYAHEVLRNLAILKNIGHNPESLNQELSLGISECAVREADRLLPAGGKLVGIAPGSVWATKRWDAAGFAAVADKLADAGCRTVLLGSSTDRETGKAVLEAARSPILDLIGKTDVPALAAVIAKLDLLITNDSAPLHFASALGVPVLALFCATIPEMGFGPWRVRHEIAEVKELSCRPCGRHGGKVCPLKTFACGLGISTDQVFQKAALLLNFSLQTTARAEC